MLTVDTYLKRFAGKTAYLHRPFAGNGDLLIEAGSREALRRLGVAAVKDPAEASVILLNGCGMVEHWTERGELTRFVSRFPERPFCVLPSSFGFAHLEVLASLVPQRSAETVIFARERRSLDILQKAAFRSPVEIGLDHDMAFWLSGSDLLESLSQVPVRREVVVAHRWDAETTGASLSRMRRISRAALLARPLVRAFPHEPRRLARMGLTAALNRSLGLPPGINRGIGMLLRDHPELRHCDLFVGDLGHDRLFTYEQFHDRIAGAAAVVTDRLHAAILASLLGKPTYLVESGWFKARGVWEYTLQEGFPQTVFVAAPAPAGSPPAG